MQNAQPLTCEARILMSSRSLRSIVEDRITFSISIIIFIGSGAFEKLSKAGIVGSVPGVKGGYKLAKSPDEISFWDVVEAVEGAKPIFRCQNIPEYKR